MSQRFFQHQSQALILAVMLASLMLVCGSQSFSVAQDGSKSIKSEEFLGNRPSTGKAKTGASKSTATQTNRAKINKQTGKQNPGQTANRTRQPQPDPLINVTQSASSPQGVYRVDASFPIAPPPNGQEYARMGVTIWQVARNECPNSADLTNCPALPNNGKGLVDMPTRLEDNARLTTGSLVRIGLESLSHSGYMYIIDREQFADGTFGPAYLLFPTKTIYEGNHLVQPGALITLPRPGGCFCIKPRDSQKTLVADVLSVIISPVPLLGEAEIGNSAVPLPDKLVDFLSRANKEKTSRATLQGGAGLAQTGQEKAAGEKGLLDTAPALTQTDLPPQNIYQSLIPRGSSAVFTFFLRYHASLAVNKP